MRRGAAQPSERRVSSSAAAAGLLPGQGPMPAAMPLGAALQEMMVRFYRFERYAVPLMRAIEGRVVDIERDAQMAAHPAASDASSSRSARDAEMDKWVGQMTGLIRHEIGQLRAATAEIRGGRELLAAVAGGRAAAPASPAAAAAAAISNSSAAVEAPSSRAAIDSAKAAGGAHKPAQDKEQESQANKDDGARRLNNISSASFTSAVPRRGSVGQQRQDSLKLPQGARPQLDKDEGKSNSSSNSGLARQPSHDAAGSRPVSPSGRPRYTSALGQPLQNGRLSPVRGGSPAAAAAAAADEGDDATSDVSTGSRAQSIDERLKALVDHKLRSPSTASDKPSLMSEGEMVEHDDATSSMARSSSNTTDNDYAMVPSASPTRMRGADGDGEEEEEEEEPRTPLRRQKDPSTASARSEATYVPVAFPSPLPSPSASASEIRTSGLASQGLRARAQSYLQNAESRSSSSSLLSTPRSPAARSLSASSDSAGKQRPPSESAWLASSPKSSASRTSASHARETSADSAGSTRPLTIKKSVNSLSGAAAGRTTSSSTSPTKDSFGSSFGRKVAGGGAGGNGTDNDDEEQGAENAPQQATIRAKKSPVSSVFLDAAPSTTTSLSTPKKRGALSAAMAGTATTTTTPGGTSFRDRIAFFDAAAR